MLAAPFARRTAGRDRKTLGVLREKKLSPRDGRRR